MKGLVLAAALGAGLPCALAAQVGHPPGGSPYHDIAKGSSFTAVGGYFGGSGGSVGVGPNSGYTLGLRFDFRAGNPLQFGAEVSHGWLERLHIDPTQPEASRVRGTIDQPVTFAQINIQLNLTGSKSWHGFAPFAALSGGFAFATRQTVDTSGYNFGNRFLFSPNAGLRLFLGERLHLRGAIRAAFWKINYPLSFRTGTPAVLPDGRESEWVLSPWYEAGIGYTF
ncbi:MAG TPA: hypothetical protein VFK09_01310 [Gemmatimonadales bacterium]|jgi:hypothetical protein|nr:hypothetical protein [Gemmatimonadales bacterium]